MLPPPLVAVTMETVAEGFERLKGKTVYAKRKSDDIQKSAEIRAMKKAGVGLCSTKQRGIDIFFDETSDKYYGISQVLPSRWFEIQFKPLFGEGNNIINPHLHTEPVVMVVG